VKALLPLHRGVRTRFSLLCLGSSPGALAGWALVCLGCASAPFATPHPAILSGPEQVSASASPTYLLTLHEPFDRPLEGATQHRYRITLAGPRYIRLVIEQVGIEVSAILVAPDGATAATANGPHGWRKVKRLSDVIERPGEYVLLVTAVDANQAAGRYRLELDAFRPPAPSDRNRVDAESALSEGERLLEKGGPEAWNAAAGRLDAAVKGWSRTGDCGGELAATNTLAEVFLQLENVDRARAACDQALDLARYARDLGAEARVLLCNGRLAPAGAEQLASYRVAEQLHEALGDVSGEAEALTLLGVAATNTGEYDKSLAFHRLAYELEESGDRVRRARSATEMGLLLFLLGNGNEALTALTDSLAVSREVGDFEGEANALLQLARVQQAGGRLQEAVADAAEAVQLYKQMGDLRNEVWAIMALGNAEEYLGELESAHQRFTEALTLLGRFPGEKRSQVTALVQLASVEQSQGNLQTARDHDLEALAISQSINQPLLEAVALYAVGEVYRQQRDWENAIQALDKAAALTDRSQDPHHLAQILIEEAKVYRDAGDSRQAIRQVARALELAKGGDLEAVGRTVQAGVDRQEGRLGEAKASIERALAITEGQLQEVISPNRRISFLAKRHDLYELYIDVLMRLDSARPKAGYAEQAFQASERSHARGLFDLLLDDRGDDWRIVAPDLARRHDHIEAEIEGLLRQMLELSLRSPATPDAQLESKLRRIRDESQRVDDQVRSIRIRGLEVTRPASLDLPAAQQLLDERTALLEYAVGGDNSYLFVVTHDRMATFKLQVSSARLRLLVGQLRPTLRADGRRLYATFAANSHRLYLDLIGPAEEALAGKTHLLIAPDGPLNSLSFEILVTKLTGTAANYDLPYVIRDRSVSYVPSAGVLARLDSLAASQWGKLFIGFGDPLFESGGGGAAPPDRSSEERTSSLQPRLPASPVIGKVSVMRIFRQAELDRLPALVHSRREIESIAALFLRDQTAVYLGAEASEERVKGDGELPRTRWIHFAAHGLLSEDPELSGLVLARGGADSREDGLLDVRAIFKLKLSADMVVLSACSTGLGKEVIGEGTIGLPRAFLYAGAASVLVSLWQVDDESTEKLMVAFYKHLLAGSQKADALRLAKLELVRTQPYSFPYYWAPFVLVGRPN
jgi:CHAT domain-containing protein